MRKRMLSRFTAVITLPYDLARSLSDDHSTHGDFSEFSCLCRQLQRTLHIKCMFLHHFIILL